MQSQILPIHTKAISPLRQRYPKRIQKPKQKEKQSLKYKPPPIEPSKDPEYKPHISLTTGTHPPQRFFVAKALAMRLSPILRAAFEQEKDSEGRQLGFEFRFHAKFGVEAVRLLAGWMYGKNVILPQASTKEEGEEDLEFKIVYSRGLTNADIEDRKTWISNTRILCKLYLLAEELKMPELQNDLLRTLDTEFELFESVQGRFRSTPLVPPEVFEYVFSITSEKVGSALRKWFGWVFTCEVQREGFEGYAGLYAGGALGEMVKVLRLELVEVREGRRKKGVELEQFLVDVRSGGSEDEKEDWEGDLSLA